MPADRTTRIWLLRLAFAIVAIVVSAFAGISYVGHGIAYSAVVGAANMDEVATAEKRSALFALILAGILQLIAAAIAAPLFESEATPSLFSTASENSSAASVCFRYFAVFSVVLIVTLFIAVGVFQTLRYFNL